MADTAQNNDAPAASADGQHPKKTCTSVTDYGICSDQNWKYRRRMEDAHFVQDGYSSSPDKGFFAVYDGHGGKEAAVFCSQNFHKVLEDGLKSVSDSELISQPEKVQEVFKKTYAKTDDLLKESAVPPHHGCTVVTCLVAGSLQNNNRVLYSANAGDGRAVLCRDKKAIRLTEDHKASNEAEAKRIMENQGFIINGRVNGQIVITRSLGDHIMKEFIICDPYTQFHQLTSADTHIVVACDGLWDVVEDQAAVDFVLANNDLSASDIAKKLLLKALADGSTDNLSIIVVKL